MKKIYWLYCGVDSEIVAYFSSIANAEAYKAAMVIAEEMTPTEAAQYEVRGAGVNPEYES